MKPHPHPDDLVAFSSGLMDEGAARVIEEHLHHCQQCRGVLEELPTDPLTAALQIPEADHVSSVPTWGSLGEADREGRWDQVEAIPPGLAQHPRYRVLEMVGRGGMGLVFKAEHRFLNRLVALKVIRPRLLANPLAVERFRLEVEAAARLSHPNIVTALDADQADDLHFLIMEFVAGVNLAEWLAGQGPLAIADACDACCQAARGLQHAHELGMVHRDIKPHNLMRTPSGQVKILDFGLAHLVSERLSTACPEEAGALLGSPDYIAPEQARHARDVDIRADLYSLGCTLFYLLAGEAPFPGLDNAGKVAAHLEQPPRLLSEVRRDVPCELARLVFRLMAKHAEQRLQTPAELVKALGPFVPGSGAPGTHESCRVLMGHADRISCVAFNPYGFMLATGSHDHSALLWDVNAGQEIADLSRHTGAVRGIAFSPDGQTLATAAADGKVRLWNVTRRRKRISFKAHRGAVRVIAFHPDGQTLASAGDDGWINIWDANDGDLITSLAGHTDRVHALSFSRDGRRLSSASRDRSVAIWDFAAQRQERCLRGFPSRVSAACLHPGGRLLAVASGSVHLLELDGAERSRILPTMRGRNSCLAYSPDGDALACGCGNHILLWQLASREEPYILEGHHGTVLALSFSPDGLLLASASADRTARVWRIPES